MRWILPTHTSADARPLPQSTQVGFPRRDPDRLRAALDNTHRLVWVRATKQGRLARLGQLLGFARATRCEALQHSRATNQPVLPWRHCSSSQA